MSTAATTPAQPAPTIHEADLGSGPGGFVDYGAELTFAEAVARRIAGQDVVVRGDDARANRRTAEAIEAAVGQCVRSDPHRRAGPRTLPHFQPATRPPQGHTFYETANRKARRRP